VNRAQIRSRSGQRVRVANRQRKGNSWPNIDQPKRADKERTMDRNVSGDIEGREREGESGTEEADTEKRRQKVDTGTRRRRA
jgi:hypothetical protein